MAGAVPVRVEFAVIDDELIVSCLEAEHKAELEESRKRHDEYVFCGCNASVSASGAAAVRTYMDVSPLYLSARCIGTLLWTSTSRLYLRRPQL